ncbi:ATP-grasp domain-containing protein [Actinokineospora auranticolor]|uniref:ATP-grasp domain-containing protein n=2 Tax=Actinokineospora auranticolor TaxID=155976 RepID=A0A2S6H135_9PSEU|nr:ATP-grasp domain-containing protein [Actinokineospora auranticolor]
MSLRERAIVAALRVFDGPLVTIARGRDSRAAKFFDHVLVGDFSDPDDSLRAVVEHEKETGRVPAGVVPFFDPGLVPGWAIADHYGLPFLSRAAVDDSSINKNRMKDKLLAAGVATPRYTQVDSVEAALAAAGGYGFPCVIKPSAFGGSLGVRLVSDAAEVERAYSYARRIIDENAAVFTVKNREIQVEEFCPLVDEVSVEVLNHGTEQVVLAVTDKILGPRPYFAEIGHRVPSRYSSRSDVDDVTKRACAAIGLDRGIAHVELRLEPGAAPVVMEVGARTAGDGILDQVERVCGVSPYELHVLSYLDRLDRMPELPAPSGLAGISVLKAAPGRVSAVRKPSSVDPAVRGYEVSAVAGTRSGATQANYLDREGYVEFVWPGAVPEDVPLDTQTVIARDLSAQLFEVDDADLPAAP